MKKKLSKGKKKLSKGKKTSKSKKKEIELKECFFLSDDEESQSPKSVTKIKEN